MARTARIGGWLAAAAASVSIWAARPAAAQPDPPEPASDTIVRTVEIPVPVHDPTAEAVQMAVAAVLGAVVATGATAARLRRRSPPGTGLIDITDTVWARGSHR
jgi:hypothetical protein